MLWEYARLDDETRIACSATRADGTVRVVVERPRDRGLDSADCLLPQCRWKDVDGFSTTELEFLTDFLHNNAPLIFDMAERHSGEGNIA